jgi:hypothetical protein
MNEDFNFDDLDFEEEPKKTTKTVEKVKAEVVEPENEDEDYEDEGSAEPEEENENANADDDFDNMDVPDMEELTGDTGKKGKGKSKGKTASSGTVVPPKKKYEGPRKVIVYGEELFTVTDPTVTEEAIRERVVNDFQYPEFTKDRTIFSLNETDGRLVVGIKFEKKG